MKIKLMTTAAAAALLATSAVAGNIAPPPPDPIIAAPIVPTGPDWTGFYLGAQAGFIDVDSNTPGLGGDGGIGGIIAGYDYDFGRAVIGVGLDYDWTDTTVVPGLAPTTIDNVFRVRLRSGYEFGNGLGYITSGYAEADTNNLGTQDGYFIGLGYDHLVTDSFSVGGEVLYHEFDNVANTPIDLDATTFQLRGAYRF
jgi:predicted porin